MKWAVGIKKKSDYAALFLHYSIPGSDVRTAHLEETQWIQTEKSRQHPYLSRRGALGMGLRRNFSKDEPESGAHAAAAKQTQTPTVRGTNTQQFRLTSEETSRTGGAQPDGSEDRDTSGQAPFYAYVAFKATGSPSDLHGKIQM